MTDRSAGILLHRGGGEAAEVWIAHMGGPFWARKQERAWTVPKGLVGDGENPLDAARREFAEEIGASAPAVDYVDLGEFRYSSGKRLRVFAADGTGFDPGAIHSNLFEMEWPPRSGRMQSFPEVDRAEWVPLERARALLVASQVPMLDALLSLVE